MSQASIVEAAIASFLSPDGSERMEATFSRRLDRISRQLEKLDFHVEVGNEAVALFVRFWLGVTPSLPDEASAAARNVSASTDACCKRIDKNRVDKKSKKQNGSIFEIGYNNH